MAARSVRDHGTLSWWKCQSILKGRGSCPLGHNTSLTAGENNVYYVVYHRTRILAYHFDGAIIADCSGFRTNTTKDRLNYLTNRHIYQKKFVWYVGLLPYYDGVNLGTPRNEREALESAVMNGDESALLALTDYDLEHPNT
jgi:hypothetical protein